MLKRMALLLATVTVLAASASQAPLRDLPQPDCAPCLVRDLPQPDCAPCLVRDLPQPDCAPCVI